MPIYKYVIVVLLTITANEGIIWGCPAILCICDQKCKHFLNRIVHAKNWSKLLLKDKKINK